MIFCRTLPCKQLANFKKKKLMCHSWVFLSFIILYHSCQLYHFHGLKINFQSQLIQNIILPTIYRVGSHCSTSPMRHVRYWTRTRTTTIVCMEIGKLIIPTITWFKALDDPFHACINIIISRILYGISCIKKCPSNCLGIP